MSTAFLISLMSVPLSRLNDPDRAVVKSPRLQFILEMAESFRSMDTSYKQRVMCLTADTSNALDITLTGIIGTKPFVCFVQKHSK